MGKPCSMKSLRERHSCLVKRQLSCNRSVFFQRPYRSLFWSEAISYLYFMFTVHFQRLLGISNLLRGRVWNCLTGSAPQYLKAYCI